MPFFFAELDYRLHPNAATLEKWKDVVFGTADFMAGYPTRMKQANTTWSPFWPATEGPILRRNTIFELGYWRVALEWPSNGGSASDFLARSIGTRW